MNFSLFHSPLNELNDKTIDQMQTLITNIPNNIIEGFEFIDHPLRMINKPLMFTEDCVAVGCPDGLL